MNIFDWEQVGHMVTPSMVKIDFKHSKGELACDAGCWPAFSCLMKINGQTGEKNPCLPPEV